MDKPNGKLTNVEMSMMVDEQKHMMPTFYELDKLHAPLLKAKYDNLIQAGFTEQQAMQIVCTRPLYDA